MLRVNAEQTAFHRVSDQLAGNFESVTCTAGNLSGYLHSSVPLKNQVRCKKFNSSQMDVTGAISNRHRNIPRWS